MRNRIAFALVLGLLFALPGEAKAQVIDRIETVGAYLDACVSRALKGQGFTSRRDVTLRLSFRRDGTTIGEPVVTYSSPMRDQPEQKRFIEAMRIAFRNCAPLPFSKDFGAAIAGKIFTFRYTLTDKKEQAI